MINIKEEFPDVDYFLSCYFHQEWASVLDWKGQEPSFEAGVRSFKINEGKELVKKVKNELEKFLSQPHTDGVNEKSLLTQCRVAYNPKYDGLTVRQWLEAILVVLKEPMEKTKSEFIPQRFSYNGGNEGWKNYIDEKTKQILNIKS